MTKTIALLGHVRALALGALLTMPALVGAQAGITVQVKADDTADAAVVEEVQLYGASYALVIGVDAYTAGWPNLRNAIKDAELVAEELEKQGFQVTFETNSNAERLRQVLKEFFVLKGAEANARLLVWFAGHGHTDRGEGFLVPADAPPPGDPAFALYALPMRDFGSLVRLAKSKHVLAIFDSCFAGTIFEARAGMPPAAITQATLLPVREFLASGDADQKVADNGVFREIFLRAMRGEDQADSNGDGYLTGSELGAFMADRITNLTQGAQTPRFGKLLDVNYDRGDFVFVLPGGTQAEATTALATTTGNETTRAASGGTDPTVELAFWSSIKDSTNAADFQAYLDQFPTGTFVGLAKNRMAALSDAAAATYEPSAVQPVEPAPASGPMPVEQANPPLVDACDKYAAQTEDPGRVVAGVPMDMLNADKAVPACETAVGAYPTSERFQYQLGRALTRAERYPEALEWYGKAAEDNYPAALAALGYMHDSGLGVESDSGAAAAWYRKAADLGHAPSQYRLGVMYESGLGVERDGIEAMAWYEAAANQGYAEAQLRLGDLLSSGLIGSVDPIQALTWYTLAMRGLDSGQRAGALERRKSLVESMLSEEVGEAESRAKAWFPVGVAATP